MSRNTFLLTILPEEEDAEEYKILCEHGYMIREHPEQITNSDDCATTEAGEFDRDDDLPMLFSLIMMCAYGGLVRAIAKTFHIKFPYTVILMISGVIIGAFSHIQQWCPIGYKYTAVARISPDYILYTFLPILIFESAFSISVHTFWKSFAQIFILAFPGMILCCFATAVVCWIFFSAYNWGILISCLFGCIVSATDPVAVVSILKSLGVSEQLGVLIDGESLMNDGVAVLLFEIFHDFVAHPKPDQGVLDITGHVTLMFLRIAVGGPAWGFFMGKVVIFVLSYVYNDPPAEIAVTICAAYLTFWMSEYVLRVSAVIAVVLLGLTMSAERTVISPESEEPVHHFWEMLGYLANTILFIIVGIVISETASTHFEFIDFQYLLLLYVTLHVIRFLMLLMFYPILRRLGYGLSWQNSMIIMWGGLRGAVGICLALKIYEDEKLCSQLKVGPKILFLTCGIVFLTLCVNGTTTETLLSTLKLTEVTVGQREEMNNAVRRIRKLKWNMIRSFQLQPLYSDAHFDVVNEICSVSNPYYIPDKYEENKKDVAILHPPRPIRDNTTVCWHCSSVVENEPTIKEYREITNDARLRAIKSMKIHYLHLFEKGTLTEAATQLLLSDAELAEDKYLTIIQAQNFHKHMKAHGFYLWLRDKVIVHFRLHKEEELPPPPDGKWRLPFYRLVTKDWFEIIGFTMIFFNMITIVWDVYLSFNSQYPDDQCQWTPKEKLTKLAFHYANFVFASYYTLELLAKLTGYRFKTYVCNFWNYLDIIALIITYVDVWMGFLANDPDGCRNRLIQARFKEIFNVLRAVKLIQGLRSLRLMRPLVPRLLKKIKRQLNMQVFIGYDMGHGFVETSDAVIKFIPQITENKKVQQVLRHAMKRERNICSKDLALLHNKFPGVAVALKTRHACRIALNQMQFSLVEVKDDGLLDDNEYQMLKHNLEEKMRRLTHSPTYITPDKPLAEYRTADEDLDNKSKSVVISVHDVDMEDSIPSNSKTGTNTGGLSPPTENKKK